MTLAWADGGVAPLRAVAAQVKTTREETTLIFGAEGRPQRRIVVPPALAKQLAATLARALEEREQALAGMNAMPVGMIRSAATPQDVPEGARAMLALVQGLGAGFGLERSFKLSGAQLLEDRVILGVRAAGVAPEAFVQVCRTLGMPDTSSFESFLPQANTVGFGYEGDGRAGSFKVYLEFWDKLRRRLQEEPANVEPAPLFLGYKWRPGDAQAVVARYTCYPRLSVQAILRRLRALHQGPYLHASQAITLLAADRIRRGDSFVYVEAAEEGNPRRSFDLNFYKAGLRVADLLGPLAALSPQVEPLMKRVGERPFGHLSGGTGRDGREFLTVYYEIEGL